jgi:hypothetical protein
MSRSICLFITVYKVMWPNKATSLVWGQWDLNIGRKAVHPLVTYFGLHLQRLDRIRLSYSTCCNQAYVEGELPTRSTDNLSRCPISRFSIVSYLAWRLESLITGHLSLRNAPITALFRFK